MYGNVILTMTDRHSTYTALLMRHREMLWRLCLNRANGDSDRSKDLMQEITIALWENYDKLRLDASPAQERAWVRWQARSVFYPQPLEPLPPLSTLQVLQNPVSPDTLSPLEMDDMPLVSVDGMTLTITGASGERIKVYDNNGNLVACQVASSICIIDLFPCTDALSCCRRNTFILQIGNRPTLRLEL